MRLTKPCVTWWPQRNTMEHIAKVGRICYKSEGKKPPKDADENERAAFIRARDDERCKAFWKSGHRSMFRHGTAYFYARNDRSLPSFLWLFFTASPFIDYVSKGHKVWISTNMQYLYEHVAIKDTLEPYGVSEDEFIELTLKQDFFEPLRLLRMTFVVKTQISTSRELNRTSPNSIAEQSTRYCNLQKAGGVLIAQPCWYEDGSWWQRFLFRFPCQVADWAYRLLLRSGMKPQDARGVLPLDTYTVVAYTYSIEEWKAIIDLRYRGTTGTPHPNAKLVVGEIRACINRRLKEIHTNLTI